MDQLQQAINAAKNAGLGLEIEAGRQANIAIANAQNALDESLQKFIRDLDISVRNWLEQVQSLVNDVVNQVQQTVEQITTRTQQIINSLPFRTHEPQLTAIFPRFVAPARQPYSVELHFEGNFEYASHAGFEPTLMVAGKQYATSGNDTQNLRFLVPVTELFPVSANVMTDLLDGSQYSFTQVTLTVPWEDNGFLGTGLFSTRHEDHYQVLIGGLPASPGKLTLIYNSSHKEPYTRPFEQAGFHQASTREAGNNDDINHPWSVTPEQDFHVVRNTSYFHFTAQGDWSYSFGGDDGDHVVYYVTTIHHSIGSSGSVDFAIGFTEVGTKDVPDTTSQPVYLSWGDSKSIDYPVGSWKLIFDAFDGSHSEFKGVDNQNPFIKIRNEGGGTIIATADPKTLVWPDLLMNSPSFKSRTESNRA